MILYEKYVSKYAAFGDDDDDDQYDGIDDLPYKEVDHLTRSDVHRMVGIIKSNLSKYDKLKKCCEFIDVNSNDKFDDNGNYKSAYDIYKDDRKSDSYFKVIEGDVWSGYPNFNNNGADEYAKDKRDFIKDVNKEFNSKGIGALFTSKGGDGASISFGLKSMKFK